MERKIFLKHLLAATTLITMDGFSTLANVLGNTNEQINNLDEFASFGAIHLNITNLEKTSKFWTEIVGMKRRKFSKNQAEFGTESKTLVVVHQTATTPYQKGYSGLYHFAIHAPSISAFASMINRLNFQKYPYAPIDHTSSKSIYLDDPDGINIEFTLETPERFKRVITKGGLKMEGTDGIIRSASERLDVTDILKELKDSDPKNLISEGTYIGHVHLYANNVAISNSFYKNMGFIEANYLPEYMFADLGAGGNYMHRIVMNSWHGTNKPLAPEGSAGMKYFHIHFKDQEQLTKALAQVANFREKEDGFWILDPTGNKILLSHNA